MYQRIGTPGVIADGDPRRSLKLHSHVAFLECATMSTENVRIVARSRNATMRTENVRFTVHFLNMLQLHIALLVPFLVLLMPPKVWVASKCVCHAFWHATNALKFAVKKHTKFRSKRGFGASLGPLLIIGQFIQVNRLPYA